MPGYYERISALLNRGIRESLSAQAMCRELEGRSLNLRLEPLRLSATFVVIGGELELRRGDELAADATLSGGFDGFRRLLLGDARDTIRSGQLHLDGDAEVAEKFQALFEFATPEPEEELSRLIGDVAAHQVGQAARGLGAWAAGAVDSFTRSLREFLQEERRDLPTRTEVKTFLDDVDRLANDVDRAGARLRQLREAATR